MKKILVFLIAACSFFYSNSQVVEITSKEQFDEIVSSGVPVIIDVYASWCGPCKMIKPKYEEASKKYPEVKFLSLDGDKHRQSIMVHYKDKFKVSGYPTFFFLDASGNVVMTEVGVGNDTEFIDEGVAKIRAQSSTTKPAQSPAKPEMTVKQEKSKPHPTPLKPSQAAGPVKEVTTSQDFCSYVIESPLPVFIHFYMPACASCKDIHNAFIKLAETFMEHARFVRIPVNADNLKIISAKPGILALPSYKWLISERAMDTRFTQQEYNHLHNEITKLLSLDVMKTTRRVKHPAVIK